MVPREHQECPKKANLRTLMGRWEQLRSCSLCLVLLTGKHGFLGVSYLQFPVDTKQQILLAPFLSRYLKGPFNKPGSAINIRYPTVGKKKKRNRYKAYPS